MSTIIVIPARMASTRLPGKVMEIINGKPMFVHVAERAIAADIGPVVIATDHPHVMTCAAARDLFAVRTHKEHRTGTDRIAQALELVDPYCTNQIVLNIQADVPNIEPADIRTLAALMNEQPCDLATLCALNMDREFMANPHVVKLIGTPLPTPNHLRALYFTRALPWVHSPLYHHVGVYAYRRAALARLQRLPMGILECAESLEQLRALENGMRIDAAIIENPPVSVDTPADLDQARQVMAGSRP